MFTFYRNDWFFFFTTMGPSLATSSHAVPEMLRSEQLFQSRQTQPLCVWKAVCLPDHLLTLLSLLNKQCSAAVSHRAAGPEHSSSRMDECVGAAYTALMGNICRIWSRRAKCLEVCSENIDIGGWGRCCVYWSTPSLDDFAFEMSTTVMTICRDINVYTPSHTSNLKPF